ncbi:MAG: hypothetical protein GY754_01050 [bacterium]|nr:hypothetical protein [bacterium]
MTITIAELFKQNRTFEGYKSALVKLNGDFSFEVDDMIDLGNQYLELYPDTYSNRNRDHVQLGYQVVRISILENMLKDFESSVKTFFREMFFNISRIEPVIGNLVKNKGFDAVLGYYDILAENNRKIKLKIDQIPIGMVKERYVGGITNFYNVIYLLKQAVEKNR